MAEANAGGTGFRVLCFTAPAISMVIGVPLAGLPFEGDPRGFFAPYTLLALPWYVGVMAAPGYIAAVASATTDLCRSRRARIWMRVSLMGALVCAVVSVIGGLLMPLFLPTGITTVICCFILLRRSAAACRPAEPGRKPFAPSATPPSSR
jgi:hypothetical protein